VLKNKLQFNLVTTFVLTAALAIALAFVAGTQKTVIWTWRFSSLPPNDTTLEKWLVENGHARGTIDRNQIFLGLEKKRRAMSGTTLTKPQVPWEDLHYTPPVFMSRSTRWTVFGVPPRFWQTVIMVLGTLSLICTALTSRPHADDGVES